MFSLFNGIYDSYLAPTQLNLLVVGAPDSGKTTLLERLKVTEIPSHPKRGSGGNKTVQQRIAADEPPPSIKAALLDTGAMRGRSRHRSLSKTSLSTSGSHVSLSTAPSAGPPTTTKASNVQTTKGNAVVVTRKKRFSFCPAPSRYARSSQEQDEEIVDEESVQLLLSGDGRDNQANGIFRDDSFSSNPPAHRTLARTRSKEMCVDSLDLSTSETCDSMDFKAGNAPPTLPPPPARTESHRETSMTSIHLDDDHPISAVTNKALQPTPTSTHPEPPSGQEPNEDMGPAMLQSSPEQFNVKPNAKMLPLRMIRPTIGTNLAKIDMYGAKCHIFDVGGKMQGLWERYYDDCDAVIFCWKLGEDPDKPPKEPDSDDDSDSEDEETILQNIYKKQQELLDTVRRSIPDDVPFLILGHVFGKANTEIVGTMYNTDLLLPRYHNPMTGFCCSSAKTGAGVQSAMEWLIPLAKRQQKERLASKRELDMMLEEQGKTL